MDFKFRYCDSIQGTKGNRFRHAHCCHPHEIGLSVYRFSLCEFTKRVNSVHHLSVIFELPITPTPETDN